MKDNNDSAFQEPFVNDPHLAIRYSKGISKRLYIATAYADIAYKNIEDLSTNYILNFLGVPNDTYEYPKHFNKAVIKMQLLLADEMLTQENE